MKRLKIYKESDGFVLERVNDFSHSTMRYFETKEKLIDALETYPDLSEYDFEVDQELWATILIALQKM